MSENQQFSAMKRKAGAQRPPPEIGAMTPAKALRASLTQAAEDVAGLICHPGVVEETRTTIDAFCEACEGNQLIALLEGPERRFGIMLFDTQVLGALIEMQTTGRVASKPAEDRPPTRTDAIMCADVIDAVLEGLESRAAEADLPLAPALGGFRYAMALSEVRAIPMTLENIPYRLYAIPVDLGQGAKQGTVQLLLPFNPPGRGPRDPAEVSSFTDTLSGLVMETEAHLTGTLVRMDMPLSKVMALEVGAIIPVDIDALRHVAIEDVDGRVVAHGRLGQVEGKRALRITDGLEDSEGGGQGAGFGAPAPVMDAAPHEAPALADMGGLGDLGDLGQAIENAPDTAQAADIGNLGALGDIADLGQLGDEASEADIGEMPDLGSLGDLGSMGDAGTLGDLGSLGALGDEGGTDADLPDLASLGDMGKIADLPETIE